MNTNKAFIKLRINNKLASSIKHIVLLLAIACTPNMAGAMEGMASPRAKASEEKKKFWKFFSPRNKSTLLENSSNCPSPANGDSDLPANTFLSGDIDTSVAWLVPPPKISSDSMDHFKPEVPSEYKDSQEYKTKIHYGQTFRFREKTAELSTVEKLVEASSESFEPTNSDEPCDSCESTQSYESPHNESSSQSE